MQNLLRLLDGLYLYFHDTLGVLRLCSTIKPCSGENTDNVTAYYGLCDCKTEQSAWDKNHLSAISLNWAPLS